MKTISRYIMTLALLLTAVTGAWAEETLLLTINASSDFQSGSKTFDNIATVTLDGNFFGSTDWAGTGTITVTPANDGVTITSVKFISNSSTIEDTTAPFQASQAYDSNVSYDVFDVDGNKGNRPVAKIEVYGTAGPPLTVEWDASTKTGTFAMPGSDVVLTPQYAPTAKWDVVENVEQLPAALEGIIAGQDAAIVTAGQSAQGTVMYAVTTTAEAAPALTAFSATVPTAKNYDDATTLYVWYYIQGQDTPDGQQATEENTFNDTEICTTPLTVTIAAEPTYAVTLSDEDNDLSALDNYKGQEIYVNYTRSFTASTASTVCLPFAYTKKAADGSFYAFTNIEKVGNDYVATMTEPGLSTLEANTPYLYMPNATGDFSFSGTYTIPAELTAGSTTSGDWTFQGTYKTIEWTTAPTGIYGFSGQAVDGISQGQFVKVGAYVRIVPMRCYLKYKGGNEDYAGARSENGTNDEVLPETIKVRLISANGTVTAIGSLSTKTGEVDIWYSLDGRRVANPTKGVYIKNGRKVIK